jgi:hypothetical protein
MSSVMWLSSVMWHAYMPVRSLCTSWITLSHQRSQYITKARRCTQPWSRFVTPELPLKTSSSTLFPLFIIFAVGRFIVELLAFIHCVLYSQLEISMNLFSVSMQCSHVNSVYLIQFVIFFWFTHGIQNLFYIMYVKNKFETKHFKQSYNT